MFLSYHFVPENSLLKIVMCGILIPVSPFFTIPPLIPPRPLLAAGQDMVPESPLQDQEETNGGMRTALLGTPRGRQGNDDDDDNDYNGYTNILSLYLFLFLFLHSILLLLFLSVYLSVSPNTPVSPSGVDA